MSGRHASWLRAALAFHERARSKRYDLALKERIIEFARSRRDQGGAWVQIAGEIALAVETLRRWCMAAPVWRAGTASRCSRFSPVRCSHASPKLNLE